MFQRSNIKLQMELLAGINDFNNYCIVYDLLTKLIFGITLIGKTVHVTLLNILLARIARPRSSTFHIVPMDLGGDIGHKPDIKSPPPGASWIHHPAY
jgi:hypothetical protein